MVKMVGTYKVLSILLSYPEQALKDELDDCYKILEQDQLLSGKQMKSLKKLMDFFKNSDLITLQEHYIEMFDRCHSQSLYLFEHVHGDSRERGQAMIDLSDNYHTHGLNVGEGELPDYLPLFLEFLSILPLKEAKVLLGEPVNILEVLGQRLKDQGSHYASIFEALIDLSSAKPNLNLIKKMLSSGTKGVISGDELDKQWEDEPVLFMGAESAETCSSCSSGPKNNGRG